MKIALVGKNEKLQGVLAAECVKRGMTVTQGLPSAEDLKTVDAVVDAGEGLSAEVIKENPGIRFLVVGGEAAGENVTVFNPPEQFLPNGEKCGAYVPSTGFEVVNSVGEKAISYADAAIALADELEKSILPGKALRQSQIPVYCRRKKHITWLTFPSDPARCSKQKAHISESLPISPVRNAPVWLIRQAK